MVVKRNKRLSNQLLQSITHSISMDPYQQVTILFERKQYFKEMGVR